MNALMNFDEIKNFIPQKYPFLFLDRVLEIEEGKRIVCLKNVSGNEQFFSGHFPDTAIMPGALLVEAMAQAAAILFRKMQPEHNLEDSLFLFGGAKVRFHKPVVPGDQLIIEVTVEKMISSAAIVKAEIRETGKLVVKGTLTFAVTKKDKSWKAMPESKQG